MEGRSRERRVERRKEEEEDRLARSFHITLLSGNLLQAVYWATNREGVEGGGGGGSSSGGVGLHKDQATGCIFSPGETP